MEIPQVTCIIPVHNHARWVTDCIHSMSRSDYEKKRIIVVDDGSTDSSFDTVLSLIKNARKLNIPTKDEPKCIYSGEVDGVSIMAASLNQCRGPSFARNFAIQSGWDGTDLFALCDSDDWYDSLKIKKSVEKWLKFPSGIGVIYSDYSTVDINGVYHRQFKEPYSQRRLMTECIISCDSLFSRLVLERAGLFDPNLRTCEDFDVQVRCAEHMISTHIPENLLFIRVGHHSSTNTVPKAVWEQNYRRVFEKAQERARSQRLT